MMAGGTQRQYNHTFTFCDQVLLRFEVKENDLRTQTVRTLLLRAQCTLSNNAVKSGKV